MKFINSAKGEQMLQFRMKMLASTLRKLRKENGDMTQDELSYLADTTQNTINKIENRPNYNPSLYLIIKIAAVFNMNVQDLLKATAA